MAKMRPGDMEAFLEQEYRDFEERYFGGRSFFRAPSNVLVDTALYQVYRRFADLFPDHASDVNVVFYLLENRNVSPTMHTLRLICSHFEHVGAADLQKLSVFLVWAGTLLTGDDQSGSIDLLNADREKIILSFFGPTAEVVQVMESKGVWRDG